MNDKAFKKLLHEHYSKFHSGVYSHDLTYTEPAQEAIGAIVCATCGKILASWPLASIEPYYELHQAVDAMRAFFDKHYGPTVWHHVSFNFDKIDKRVEDFTVYHILPDGNWIDITEDTLDDDWDYDSLLEEFEGEEDYLLLLESDFSPYLIKDKYPDEYTRQD